MKKPMEHGFQPALKQWYQSGAGRFFYDQERLLLDSALGNLFGYFLVQLGCISTENIMQNSRVNCKVLVDAELDERMQAQPGLQFVQADLDFLPIGREVADLILLPHTLEFAADPHFLLRQVDSMLIPEGHIVITGFNPLGCAVMRHRWFRGEKLFRQARLDSLRKLKEWLSVLGYDVVAYDYSAVSCFSGRERHPVVVKIIEWLENGFRKVGLEFGNMYCLVAKKRVDSPTLVGLKWRMPRWRFSSGAQVSLRRKQGITNLKREGRG
ncbi:methyltransferase domain-containing protein [Thiomicrorhabdus sp.]|uniref:class I SAM-dependent methyltransferase n=1 Tax=Thiomicrorhabdus sp. TaxID=2039724 RepID=UPI0029C9600D|nr:methyltransferase domain-containing protein [Thiomicrorhabdus sp.]